MQGLGFFFKLANGLKDFYFLCYEVLVVCCTLVKSEVLSQS
jgi:hypothetical protein